jgi:hypothetical protein
VIFELVQTLAAISVPIVVAIVGYRLNQRLKLWEASQWRNQELIKARLRYFGELAPMLNDLMCYVTFIGRWKELTPPDVVAIKRDSDRLFFSVAPLFSQAAVDAYQEFLDHCFHMRGKWGADARIRSGFVRRREVAGDTWRAEWEPMFTHAEGDEITENDMAATLAAYDQVLAALVEDVELLAARQRYAPVGVSFNAR